MFRIRISSPLAWFARLGLCCAVVCCAPCAADDAPAAAAEEEQNRAAAVALNYCRASLHRIRREPTLPVLVEEREKILNNLNLNGIADEEVLKLYSSVLDEIGQIQISDRERGVISERHQRAFRRDLTVNGFVLFTQLASAQFGQAVRTGASSWWDYRNMSVKRETELWKVEKDRMTAVVNKSSQFLDTSWKMARDRDIPDRWLVRGDDLDALEQALSEPDAETRLRILRRMDPFMTCYPPYWYYVARTQQSQGKLLAAAETYEKMAALGAGHFRKDEMLAAGLANRAAIQEYFQQPGATRTAQAALELATDVWQANLMCARVLHRHALFDEAAEAALRNLDVGLERHQSLVMLLTVYADSRQQTKLARQLSDPEVLRDVPIAMLIRCATVLGDEVPANLQAHLASSLHAAPRLTFGRDDLLVAASSGWQLERARVTLEAGPHRFDEPRVAAGEEHTELRFDEALDLGGPFATLPADAELALVIDYPDLAPIRLTLSPGGIRSAARTATPVSNSFGRGPTFQIVSVETGQTRLSLLPASSRPTSNDAADAPQPTPDRPVVPLGIEPVPEDVLPPEAER